MIDKEKIVITYPVITGLNDNVEDVDNIIMFMNECSLKNKITPV